jgi:hypothetical protein
MSNGRNTAKMAISVSNQILVMITRSATIVAALAWNAFLQSEFNFGGRLKPLSYALFVSLMAIGITAAVGVVVSYSTPPPSVPMHRHAPPRTGGSDVGDGEDDDSDGA